MSKKVKSLIIKELSGKFNALDGVAVFNPRGIDATKNNLIRRRLHAKGVKVTVVKNSMAKRATAETKLQGFDKLLDGPSAVVYGSKTSISTIARLLLDEKKTDEKLELRGVFFDGEIYPGEAGVKAVSKLPTREEAIATVVASILSPGRKLAGVFKGQASKIASILKSVEEKAKEKEAAAAVAAPVAAAAEAPAPTPAA